MYEIVKGAFTQDDLISFFSSDRVMKTILPGDILVFDNCQTHHTAEVGSFLATYVAGLHAHLLFLPPYSPQLNPIEYAFGTLKRYCRHHLPNPESTEQLVSLIEEATRTLTPALLRTWYKHIGYLA